MPATSDELIAVAIAILTHDLRTPLQTISFALPHLSGALNDGDVVTCHEDLRIIHGATDVLQRMIHDLSDVSLAMRGRFFVTTVPQQVDRILAAASAPLKLAAHPKNIDVQSFCDPGLPDVLADAGRLHQVLTNLGEHAIRFTPPRGRVSLRATRGSDVVVFEISCSGPGIPAAHLSGIFELIPRDVDTPGIGMGLGLAIAKSIVEAHRGKISVTSDPRLGTTFHFGIPIDRPAPANIRELPNSLLGSTTTPVE